MRSSGLSLAEHRNGEQMKMLGGWHRMVVGLADVRVN